MEFCELPHLHVVTYSVNDKSVHVIRDDVLEAGTKERGVNFFRGLDSNVEGVVAIASVSGFGQIAIAKMAKLSGMSSYIVVAGATYKPNELIDKTLEMGGSYIKVNRFNDLLHYYDPIDGIKISIPTGYPGEPRVTYISSSLLSKVAEDFGDRHPELHVMGLGLEDPQYVDKLAESIRDANIDDIYPKRMWITVGSGTLLRAFVKVWPDTEFMCVQVGRKIDKLMDNIPKSQIRVANYKYFESVTDPKLLPPFPSLSNYDAKAWEFIINEAQDGDYFWNVAGDV